MGHILIIEDNEAVRGLFQQVLEIEGYSVAVAGNGHEGLAAAREREPDLVITDIMMPEMDGLELIQRLRANSPGLPVIAISGGMREAPFNFLSQAEQMGANKTLEKPVALAELINAVKTLLATA
ncbi:MAG: response regulator [Kiritimatiellales bacterium]